MELNTKEYQELAKELISVGWSHQKGSTYDGESGVIFSLTNCEVQIHLKMINWGPITLWEPIIVKGEIADFPNHQGEIWELIRVIMEAKLGA
jgi:hypothetical protein